MPRLPSSTSKPRLRRQLAVSSRNRKWRCDGENNRAYVNSPSIGLKDNNGLSPLVLYLFWPINSHCFTTLWWFYTHRSNHENLERVWNRSQTSQTFFTSQREVKSKVRVRMSNHTLIVLTSHSKIGKMSCLSGPLRPRLPERWIRLLLSLVLQHGDN